MLSLNPNRFIRSGYFRSSFIDNNGVLQLIPNELVEYVYQKILGENETNKEFDAYIEAERFIVMNGMAYTKLESPNTLNILELEISNETDVLAIVELFKSLLIGTIIIHSKTITTVR